MAFIDRFNYTCVIIVLIHNAVVHVENGKVTESEFVPVWMAITHQSKEMATAFFYLADLNDDNVIDDKDLLPMYTVFDTNGEYYNEYVTNTYKKYE